MSLLSLYCRTFVVLMFRCYRVVFLVFRTVLELLPRYCPKFGETVVALLSLCCHVVIELLWRCYRAVFTLLSRGCYAVVALLLRCFSLLLRSCRSCVLCAVVSLRFLHCCRALVRLFFYLILAQAFFFYFGMPAYRDIGCVFLLQCVSIRA